jgi:hypothetical protein
MNLDSRGRVHLEWMFENQPELVRELHRQNKLADHLEEKMQVALRRVMQLRDERGLSEDEAFDVAMHEILAPAESLGQDNPPEPVPYREQEAIYQRLESQ